MIHLTLTNMNAMNRALSTKSLWRFVLAPQIAHAWEDRSQRGSGNRAARRAIRTQRGRDHILWAGEDIYTERPEILKRGHLLLIWDQRPEIRGKDESR